LAFLEHIFKQVTIKNRMESPLQLCFLQFAQATILFQTMLYVTMRFLPNYI
jgi:hypothetical protein